MPIGENPNEPGSHPVPVARTFNERKKAAFLTALVKTGSITGASARIGISRDTVYDHARKDPAFADAIERARGQWEQSLLEKIESAGRGKNDSEPGDWRALAWLLEHSPASRDRYGGVLRQRVQVSGDPEGSPIRTENVEVRAVEIGPDTMERLSRVVGVLARAGKLRLPDPNEIEGAFQEVEDEDAAG